MTLTICSTSTTSTSTRHILSINDELNPRNSISSHEMRIFLVLVIYTSTSNVVYCSPSNSVDHSRSILVMTNIVLFPNCENVSHAQVASETVIPHYSHRHLSALPNSSLPLVLHLSHTFLVCPFRPRKRSGLQHLRLSLPCRRRRRSCTFCLRSYEDLGCCTSEFRASIFVGSRSATDTSRR